MRSRLPASAAALALLATVVAAPAATAADPTTDGLVFSEYVEGSSFQKAVEIYNGTGAPVSLAGFEYRAYQNANGDLADPNGTFELPDTVLEDGDVFTIANPRFNDDEGLVVGGDVDAFSGVVNHNGDDAFTLVDPTGAVVDSFKIPGADISNAGNVTLRRTDLTRRTDPTAPEELDRYFAPDERGASNDVSTLGLPPGDAPEPEPDPECDVTELTAIQDVQGRFDPVDFPDGLVVDRRSGPDQSPLVGETVTVRGVVTLADDDLSGFFVQDPVGDDDPFTSDGVFVFSRGELPLEGETVEVTGDVGEFFNNTQVGGGQVAVCDVPLVEVAPTALDLPADDLTRENLEGMVVTNTDELFVTGLFTAYANGELGLSIDGPLTQPTSAFPTDSPEAQELAERNAESLVYLNDRDEAFSRFNPFPWERFVENLSAGDTFDPGAVTGVVRYTFRDHLIEPLDNEVATGEPIFFPEPDDTDTRDAVPTLADGNDVAAFNVLNYFNTLNLSGDRLDGLRGAESPEDFAFQEDKIVDALNELDAAVVGLIEIENDYGALYDDDESTEASVETLVDALNEAAGSDKWDFVAPAAELLVEKAPEMTDEPDEVDVTPLGLGTDAIANAIIFQPERAQPTGTAATFDIDALLEGDSENSRWPLAQTFQVVGPGPDMTVAVNHFKSKGSSCADTAGPHFEEGDDDGSTLAGNCDLTRVYAAERLVEWLDSRPTGVDHDRNLIVGDLNSYEEEAPIRTLEDAGYLDNVEVQGDDAFTYKFDGRFGRLDYVMASPRAQKFVTDAEVWQINSRAPFGYLYDNNPVDRTAFASSDHDPVVVSIGAPGRAGGDNGKGPRNAR